MRRVTVVGCDLIAAPSHFMKRVAPARILDPMASLVAAYPIGKEFFTSLWATAIPRDDLVVGAAGVAFMLLVLGWIIRDAGKTGRHDAGPDRD